MSVFETTHRIPCMYLLFTVAAELSAWHACLRLVIVTNISVLYYFFAVDQFFNSLATLKYNRIFILWAAYCFSCYHLTMMKTRLANVVQLRKSNVSNSGSTFTLIWKCMILRFSIELVVLYYNAYIYTLLTCIVTCIKQTGIDTRRQNLTSVDDRFWRLKTIMERIKIFIMVVYIEIKWIGLWLLLCPYRLNWVRRTSWGWWDEWDDTALQTQDSKFEPWWSQAEHAISRSRRLPTMLI